MAPPPFEDSTPPAGPPATPSPLVALSDVAEGLLVRIELPGVKSAEVDVSVRGGALLISRDKAPARSRNLPKLRDLREDVCFRAEYLYLHRLVSLTGHNIRRACELSGLSRSRLYTLLKKYQITTH